MPTKPMLRMLTSGGPTVPTAIAGHAVHHGGFSFRGITRVRAPSATTTRLAASTIQPDAR